MGIWENLKRPFLSVVKSSEDQALDTENVKRVQIQYTPIGSSGIEIYSGYYSEDYLSALRGSEAADVWDKMRRSDPKVKMILTAVKNPIKGAQWEIAAANDTPEAKLQAELIEQILFKDTGQSWTQTLNEILTFLEFGFSAFEITHKVVIGHPKFGNYNSLRSFGYRSQKTIERWNLDKETGKLLSIEQNAYGDLHRNVTIPEESLIIFTNEKEGDNYEGVSALRPCYGPFIRKNAYLKLMAIGIEKFAVPTPTLKVPLNMENSPQYSNALTVLRKYVSHQQQFITLPEGWEINFTQTNFDAEKVRSAIDSENKEMVHAFLANFLELGSSGSGSYALSYDLSDFFLTGIEYIAEQICDTINQQLIPKLVRLNFGEQQEYPRLRCAGITDKPGRELSEVLRTLAQAKVITPDDKLEADIRERYGLPEKSLEGQRVVEPQPQQFGLSEKILNLAEKPKTPRGLIALETENTKFVMQESLKAIGTKMIADIISKYKRATPAQVSTITNEIDPSGYTAYKQALVDQLVSTSFKALEQVKKDAPRSVKMKLSEKTDSLMLASPKFSDLPVEIQRRIREVSELLSTTQLDDLKKQVQFQYSSSYPSTDSLSVLESDLNFALDKFLESASISAAASSTAARIVNENRENFFYDPDVFAEVESFTFLNPDPVSPICQDLAGTTFSKDDPEIGRYTPPLHHNCKSYLVANYKGSNKEIKPLAPSNPELNKYITLAEGMIAINVIDVSKETVMTRTDADRLVLGFTSKIDPVIENETHYRYIQNDNGTFEEGTLRTFEPMKGVTIVYGKQKKVEPSNAPSNQIST